MEIESPEELTWESLPLDHFTLDLSTDLKASPSTDLKAPSTDLDATQNQTVSLDILPDDIIERILSFLPIASVIRASATCARWRDIIRARNRSLYLAPAKPWYFMFTQNESAGGFAYDPSRRKWFSFSLPCFEKSTWLVSSSNGLISCTDSDPPSKPLKIFISNPITRHSLQLPSLNPSSPPDYSSLSLSLNPTKTLNYMVALTQSKQVLEDNFQQWEMVINLYESDPDKWSIPVKEVLNGWRSGDDSVICNNILYCLMQSTGVTANTVPRHRIIIYNLSNNTNNNNDNNGYSLMDNSVPVPCPLTCGRLMNLNEKLILVGGIAKNDRPDIIKGIGIWELLNSNWREVSRMPHKYFQGFGEFDDVFASSGAMNLVYIQSYGSTMLLVFEMEKREWRWAGKCPVSKRFPLQLFSGFCFEPRLETCLKGEA